MDLLHTTNTKELSSDTDDGLLAGYEKYFNSIIACVVIHDIDGRIVFANNTAERLFDMENERLRNLPLEYWKGKLYDENEHPLKQSCFPFSLVLETGTPIEDFILGLQFRSYQEIRWFIINTVPIKNRDGNIIYVVNTFQEITKLKQTQNKLIISEKRNRDLLELAPAAIITINAAGFITSANQLTLEIIGYSADEYIGKHFSSLNLFKIKDIPRFTNYFTKAIIGIKVPPVEFEFNRKDGSLGWALGTYKLITNEDNKKEILAVIRDITEQKEYERKIEESQKKLTQTLDATTAGIWEWDFTRKATFSQGYYTMLGYEPDEFESTYDSWVHLLHPDDKQKAIGTVERYLETKTEIYENEFRLRTKNGQYRWIHSRGKVVERDNSGNPIKMIGNNEDITERKQIEIALEQSEQQKDIVLSSTQELFAYYTTDLKVIWANKAALQNIHLDQAEITGRYCYELWTHRDTPCENCPVLQALKTGEPHSGEQRTPDGRYWMIRGYPVFNDAGDITNLVELTMDITEQRKTEEELKKAHENIQLMNKHLSSLVNKRTEELENVLKQKDEFINHLGHDLKNPLGPLVSLLPVMEKRCQDEKEKEMITVLNRNVNYMTNLVKKTLQLAQLNSPHTIFQINEVLLIDLMNHIMQTNTFLLKKNNIEVYIDIPSDLSISCDRLRIKEVFNNLLNNVVKYSQGPGKICIKAMKKDDMVTVSLLDTGIGMTEEQISHAFEEFYKADPARHDFEGSGLGLTICKRIIEKHNGKIWVESKGLGKGCTFYFTIPIEPYNE